MKQVAQIAAILAIFDGKKANSAALIENKSNCGI